jgi:hypothetical protein
MKLWHRHWPVLAALLFAAAALLPLARSAAAWADAADTSDAAAHGVEWPTSWEGRPLRPLAISAVEQRFAAQFPGSIARFTDGQQVFVLREVSRPTRMLHPAADCFRGLGHRIGATRLERDAEARLWRCFESVAPDGERLRVCERIEGAGGDSFVDTSAWFWAAAFGRSIGPWRAVTVVEAI